MIEMEGTMSPSYDEDLDNVLSLSPPQEFDDPNLFQELADFIEQADSDGNASPLYDCLSTDSEDLDVVKTEDLDTVLGVKEQSAGEDELIRYLTNPDSNVTDVGNDGRSVSPNVITTVSQLPDSSSKVSRIPTLKVIEGGKTVTKPIVTSGNHSVVRVGNNNVRVLNAVRIVRRSDINTDVKNVNSKPALRPESPSESVSSSRSGRCLSKSAIAARENREKKKKYIGNLERSVKDLSSANKTLKGQVNHLETQVDNLQNEVEYLKSVIANQSTISNLLQNIPGLSGVSLRTSAHDSQMKTDPKKRAAQDSDEESCVLESNQVAKQSRLRKKQKLDHDYANANVLYNKSVSGTASRTARKNQMSGGVCLHVSGPEVSLEFCKECSKNAASSKLASTRVGCGEITSLTDHHILLFIINEDVCWKEKRFHFVSFRGI